MSLSYRNVRLARVLAIALPLVAAAPAGAAVVSVKDTRATSTSDLTFKAARGEVNRVRFEVKAKRVTVTDAGARLQAGRGCTAAGAHQVVCKTRLDEFYSYNVSLGDGDDRATFLQRGGGELAIPDVTAGRGDDVVRAGSLKRYGFLTGGPGDDRITGTTDSDTIRGGAGRDILIGLKGSDQFVTDPSGAAGDDDEVRGGPGADEVSYSGRTRPISIDLRRSSPQGSAGEKDVFHSVESAVGTVRDDKLLGNAAENDLQGIGGRDVIEGYGRDDRVWSAGGKRKDTAPDTMSGGAGADIVLSEGGGTAAGGPGDDEFQGSGTLDGGQGDDVFEPTGGQVECGAGDDGVSIGNVTPPVLVDCESVRLGRNQELSISLPLQRADDAIVASGLNCDQEDGPTPDGKLCNSELTVALGDELLAKGTLDANNRTTLRMAYEQGAKEALGADPKQVRAAVGKYSFYSFL
ncbi:MAG: hypothetical protein QOI98_3704 [Solirubrobacteraceae bacterium]|nr:hypothetical protein [Solirubrobacteraceae bacterium]